MIREDDSREVAEAASTGPSRRQIQHWRILQAGYLGAKTEKKNKKQKTKRAIK